MSSLHQPVLVEEVIKFLNLKSGDKVIDGTVGGAGHALEILKVTAPHGQLLAVDADNQAVLRARERLSEYSNRVKVINDNFKNLYSITIANNFNDVQAVLLDLGWSADQLVDLGRGFSFSSQGQLDMRYDVAMGFLAKDLLNNLKINELSEMFKKLGGEPQSQKLAKTIVERRKFKPLTTVADLLEVIALVKGNRRGRLHPATKIWQALRLAVNRELEVLEQVLPQIVDILKIGGRLAVISFHSGEDRIVKKFFKKESKNCICPPELPVCRCRHQASLKIITTKPIKPTNYEIKINHRARSATLRVAQKI